MVFSSAPRICAWQTQAPAHNMAAQMSKVYTLCRARVSGAFDLLHLGQAEELTTRSTLEPILLMVQKWCNP